MKDAKNCADMSHLDTSNLFGLACSKGGCLPVYADDGIYLTTGKDREQNQWTIETKFRAIKDFLTDCGLSFNDGKTSLTEMMLKQKRGRLRGSPPELTVQVLEEGQIIDKTIKDSKVCRFLGERLLPVMVLSSCLQEESNPALDQETARLSLLSKRHDARKK